MTRRIIHDCDPGHDDAVALLLALASPELEVVAVTTTHGNVALPRTTENALRLLALAQRDVPVHAGADRPLLRPALHAPQVHGESGIGDVRLPDPVQEVAPTRAAQAIVDEARRAPGLTVVATGPLTNVALALRLEPRLPELLTEVVVMGGSTDAGNASPAAEFNFLADPHAARMVFDAAAEAGLKLTMFGLNVTRQVPVRRQDEARLRAVGTACARACADFMNDYLSRLEARGRAQYSALHDPCTIAYLIQPDLFAFQDLRVWIDDAEGLHFGRSLADVGNVSDEAPNAKVAVRADANAFYDLLAERMARLP